MQANKEMYCHFKFKKEVKRVSGDKEYTKLWRSWKGKSLRNWFGVKRGEGTDPHLFNRKQQNEFKQGTALGKKNKTAPLSAKEYVNTPIFPDSHLTLTGKTNFRVYSKFYKMMKCLDIPMENNQVKKSISKIISETLNSVRQRRFFLEEHWGIVQFILVFSISVYYFDMT